MRFFAKNTGFTIITISSDCTVHFNANLLLQNGVFTFGLKPKVIYQLKHVFMKQTQKEVWAYKITLIVILSVGIFICTCGMVVGFIALRQVKKIIRSPAPQVHELEKLNIPAREVEDIHTNKAAYKGR